MFSVGLPSGQGSKSGSTRQAVRKLTLALWVSGGMLLSASASVSAFARNADKPADAVAGMPTVALVTLPAQAQTTYRLILGAGPFPYDKDGTVFGNRERLLPQAPRGHYREYTVKTPGLTHRGARRIVCGGKPPSQPEACFYTDDHYASFRLIAK